MLRHYKIIFLISVLSISAISLLMSTHSLARDVELTAEQRGTISEAHQGLQLEFKNISPEDLLLNSFDSDIECAYGKSPSSKVLLIANQKLEIVRKVQNKLGEVLGESSNLMKIADKQVDPAKIIDADYELLINALNELVKSAKAAVVRAES